MLITQKYIVYEKIKDQGHFLKAFNTENNLYCIIRKDFIDEVSEEYFMELDPMLIVKNYAVYEKLGEFKYYIFMVFATKNNMYYIERFGNIEEISEEYFTVLCLKL